MAVSVESNFASGFMGPLLSRIYPISLERAIGPNDVVRVP